MRPKRDRIGESTPFQANPQTTTENFDWSGGAMVTGLPPDAGTCSNPSDDCVNTIVSFAPQLAPLK